MTTYCIKRFYSPTHPTRANDVEITRTNLTLEEAQQHCRCPSTHEKGLYFDGYEKE